MVTIVRYFAWDQVKNDRLMSERGISFEEIVYHIQRGDLLDILEHPNQVKYGGQRVFVVNVNGYVCRKATKRYLQEGEPGEETES